MREIIEFIYSSPDGGVILGCWLTFLALGLIDLMRFLFRERAHGCCDKCRDWTCPAHGCARRYGRRKSSESEVSYGYSENTY